MSGVSGVQYMSSLLDATTLSTSFASDDPEVPTSALAEMLERFPDRLLEAHLPPYWSDAQAAYW